MPSKRMFAGVDTERRLWQAGSTALISCSFAWVVEVREEADEGAEVPPGCLCAGGDDIRTGWGGGSGGVWRQHGALRHLGPRWRRRPRLERGVGAAGCEREAAPNRGRCQDDRW